jgi:hypothetical protein
MLRPFQISRISTSFLLVAALSIGAFAAGSSRGKDKTTSVRHKTTTASHDTKAEQPPAPKSAAELQQELASFFKSGRFANDSVQVQVEPQKIVLTGTVHGAENKGVATTQSRLIARKGGWDGVHVMNHLQVSLPQAW